MTSELYEHEPIADFICCKMGFLVKSNAIWNNTMVSKTLHKSNIPGGFDRSTVCGEGNSFSKEVSIQ